MRGIYFPNANLIFDVQQHDPGSPKAKTDRVNQPDFQRFAREMREAGRIALQAARRKNQEKVSGATSNIADACSNCHEVYRDKGPADSPARCTPPAAAPSR